MGQLLKEAILCTIDVVRLYANIPYKECLVSLRRFLHAMMEKKMTTETLIELAAIVIKNEIFYSNEKTLKQLRGAPISATFSTLYTILHVADLKERFLENTEVLPSTWYTHMDEIFFIWEHGLDSLEQHIETINAFHLATKLTTVWSDNEIRFLDVRNKQLEIESYIKPTNTQQFTDSTFWQSYHCKENIHFSQVLRYQDLF